MNRDEPGMYKSYIVFGNRATLKKIHVVEEEVKVAVRECTETDYKVKFVEEKDATKAAEKIVKKPAFFNDLYINPKLTFDSFVVGPSNREASQAALMIASNPGKMYNPLFL